MQCLNFELTLRRIALNSYYGMSVGSITVEGGFSISVWDRYQPSIARNLISY